MVTKLDKSLKREIEIDGTAYTVTIGPDGLRLVPKRHRKGKFVSWSSLIALGISEGEGDGDSADEGADDSARDSMQ